MLACRALLLNGKRKTLTYRMYFRANTVSDRIHSCARPLLGTTNLLELSVLGFHPRKHHAHHLLQAGLSCVFVDGVMRTQVYLHPAAREQASDTTQQHAQKLVSTPWSVTARPLKGPSLCQCPTRRTNQAVQEYTVSRGISNMPSHNLCLAEQALFFFSLKHNEAISARQR